MIGTANEAKEQRTSLCHRREGADKPITWMDHTIDGYPVVDRQGYIGVQCALVQCAMLLSGSLRVRIVRCRGFDRKGI